MAKLSDLGYAKGVIVETIVSTCNKDGRPNAAPMGATLENDGQIILRLYNTSLTLKNLKSNKCASLNVTSNIDMFYKTAFKEVNPHGALPKEWFEKAETVNAPKLKLADATIEVTVAALTPLDSERTQALCDVKLVKATKTLPQAYCRAFGATLEAIVHATRVKVFLTLGEKRQSQVQELLRNVQVCNDVVHRVAPNSRYAAIMAELAELIESWRSTP